MKFYYFQGAIGFVSISKNQFVIYNETQQANRKSPLCQSEMTFFLHANGDHKLLERVLNIYQENKYKTFEELNVPDSDWNIK